MLRLQIRGQTGTIEAPVIVDETFGNMDLEGTAQVVLINDDVNSIEHVISCLMDVFGHGEQIATKIAIETHKEGQAIAEVEGKTEAILHKEQLISYGLTAEVQNI